MLISTKKFSLLSVQLQSWQLIGKVPEDKPWNNERAAETKWPGAVDFYVVPIYFFKTAWLTSTLSLCF